MLGPATLQLGPRRADVAGEGVALAYDRIDQHLDPEGAGKRSDRLECPCVRGGDDAGNPLAGETADRLGDQASTRELFVSGAARPYL